MSALIDDNNIETKIVEISTKVIIHAGNARAFANKAIDLAESGLLDDQNIDELLKSADDEILAAHLTQTKLIQREAKGEQFMYSLLLAHAQDSLMTAMTEVHITKRIIDLFRVFATQYEKKQNNG